MQPITFATARYIKFGGSWEDFSLDRGELHFGYAGTPHELALSGDREAVKTYLVNKGKDKRKAAEEARQVVDFYCLGADCLWITFARGHLWWTFAEPKITWLGLSPKEHGERIRKCIGGWKNTDINGRELKTVNLSTKLTMLAIYRRTICKVSQSDYLLRCINGVEEPIIAEANKVLKALIDVMAEAIATLHWADFETLVDMIFARSGWHRASAIGGNQAIIDLAVEQAITGERAAVQVKSQARQTDLDDFLEQADEMDLYDRLFFVCHSAKGCLSIPEGRDDVRVWSGRELAATAAKVGLQDWIFEKVA